MRSIHSILLLLPCWVLAQPGPPSVTFLVAKDQAELIPMQGDVQAILHFRQKAEWGITPRNLGTEMELQQRTVFTDREGWNSFWMPNYDFHFRQVLITAGSDTMWLELPDHIRALEERAEARSSGGTPEVIRFRAGRYNFTKEITNAWNEEATWRLARMITGDQLEHHQYRTPRPDDVLTARDTIMLDKTSYHMEEVLHARVSGAVMTDGSCSAQPRYEIRSMRPVTGLVVDLCSAHQMDCGLSTVFWNDQHLELSLADRTPGMYALVVCGVGMAEFEIME